MWTDHLGDSDPSGRCDVNSRSSEQVSKMVGFHTNCDYLSGFLTEIMS
jgi:hypothetical protein